MIAETIWNVIKLNLRDPPGDEAEFRAFCAGFGLPGTRRGGFRREWLLRIAHHPSELGDPGQEFAAVYERGEPVQPWRALEGDSRAHWGSWSERVHDFQQDWYRVLASVEQDALPGHYWAVIRANFKGSAAEEEAFNAWYSTKHMPEVCANPGFHRAWRLQRGGATNQLSSADFKYWAVYEIDSPEDFAEVRRRNTNPWDGLWQSHVEGFRRSYHRLIRPR